MFAESIVIAGHLGRYQDHIREISPPRARRGIWANMVSKHVSVRSMVRAGSMREDC